MVTIYVKLFKEIVRSTLNYKIAVRTCMLRYYCAFKSKARIFGTCRDEAAFADKVNIPR